MKEHGIAAPIKKSLFETKINIDTEAINAYNTALNNGIKPQKALAEASKYTNEETIALMKSTKGATVSTEQITAAQKSSTLAAKAQSAALQALSTIGNMAMFAFISAAVQFAATAISNWIHRVEIAKEAMQEAVSEYESTKSNLESINSELEQQNQII